MTHKNHKALQEFVASTHNGQQRRNGSQMEHIERVVQNVYNQYNHEDIEGVVTIAYLHDIIEDTDITLRDLYTKCGFGCDIVACVDMLSKPTNLTYKSYIKKMCNHYKKATSERDSDMFRWVLNVKIADLQDNINNKPTIEQLLKYGRAMVRISKTLLNGNKFDNPKPEHIV